MEKGLGVLLPVASLYSRYGVGSLGDEAKKFIDILSGKGYAYWQMLPLSPTGYGDSPYQACSAFALNPYFIDLDILFKKGLLNSKELKRALIDGERIDYGSIFLMRLPLLKSAFSRFDRNGAGFLEFKAQNPYLGEYALYMAAKEKNYYLPWYEWKNEFKYASGEFLNSFKSEFEREIDFWMFCEYEFCLQWRELKDYAAGKNVRLIGDMPIYVAYDSAEVWLHPEYFLLDKKKVPVKVAGVPPDYFSETGQLWGNPLYKYSYMKKDGYRWMKDRIAFALRFFDYIRIDHFRGFDRFFAVPYGNPDAREGEWKKAPGYEIFKDFKEGIIAEDLGVLDEGVYRLMRKTGYPGMKILSFAFDSNPANPYKPENYTPSCVAYTGTHDNAPLIEFVKERLASGKDEFIEDVNSSLKACGEKELDVLNLPAVKEIAKSLIVLLKNSRADVKIFPIQDLLFLDGGSRINTPSVLSANNWTWRLQYRQMEKI